MAQQQGWSSLPADLVNRVADCLLATNDLDYYDDLRGVCHHWRSATADPRRNQHDPRFRATRWVMLDEHEYHYSAGSDGSTDGDAFVNIATGRFVRKNLAPLLRDHVLLTTTAGGLLVLAARRGGGSGSRPHGVPVRVANPFTGSVIRFAAPLQNAAGLRFAADVVGFSHTLVLVSVTSNEVFWADPQSESFSVDTSSHGNCPACRLPLIAAGKCAAVVMGQGRRRESLAVANNIVDQLIASGEDGGRCYVVEAGPVAGAGELLAVLKRRNGVDVFNIDSARNSIERVRSIGTCALFLGIRSFLVDADSFPTIKPNCAYFLRTDIAALARDVYKFDIAETEQEEERKPEWVEEGIRDNDFIWPINLRPFTVTQLLCNYTMDILCHQPMWEGSCFGEYIDNVGHLE